MYGVLVTRSANSVFGFGQAWLKRDGKEFETTKDDAKAVAKELQRTTRSPHLHYQAKERQKA